MLLTEPYSGVEAPARVVYEDKPVLETEGMEDLVEKCTGERVAMGHEESLLALLTRDVVDESADPKVSTVHLDSGVLPFETL